ncbi:MAG: hypothetical protein JSV49_12610 [Thermoplasmata archaeon]|nr:MAG: hypothetical protein JSV49_12610 [Thermoplasmata archaeon]
MSTCKYMKVKKISIQDIFDFKPVVIYRHNICALTSEKCTMSKKDCAGCKFAAS